MAARSLQVEDTRLEDALASADDSAIGLVYELDTSTRDAMAAHPTIRLDLTQRLLDYSGQRKLPQVSRVLDLALGISETHAELFFALLETAFAVLPLNSVSELWSYPEKRADHIAKLAQGTNSVVYLRTCRSVLARLDPQLHSHMAGRIIQLLAVTKGFAHPGRLNKRGKVAAAASVPERDQDLTPYLVTQIFQDLSQLPERDLAEFLTVYSRKWNKLRSANWKANSKVTLRDAFVDLHGWTWSDFLPPEAARLLAEISLIALSTITSKTNGNEAMQNTITKLTTTSLKVLERDYKQKAVRVFGSEQIWREWKEKQCPSIEKSSLGPLRTEFSDKMPLNLIADNNLYPLMTKIGNERLTKLLQSEPRTEEFSCPEVLEPLGSEGHHNSPDFSNNAEAQSLQFLARRCESWQLLIEQQIAEPENLHEELKEAEQQYAEGVSANKRPSHEATEPLSKRPRISYEDDTRYQDRQREATAKAEPLPY